MERWRGRLALVTGASVGIGASICMELVKHGIKVVGCARDVRKIENLAQDLPEGSLIGIKCDLQHEAEILSMFKEIRDRFGRLDICINNAGFSTMASLLNGPTEDFRAMLNVNVLALCICSKEAIKLMRENNIDDGQIIQINSTAGHSLLSDFKAYFYSATKAMDKILAEGLKRELRQENSRIRVASISPGLTQTEFLTRMGNDPNEAEAIYTAMQALQPKDIANCVVSILQMPDYVDINDIIIRPVGGTE